MLIPGTVYFVLPHEFRWLHVKLTGREIPETLAAIDKLWREVGEPRPMTRLFLSQEVQNLYRDIKRQTDIFTAFTGIAVFVACLGLFGLAASAAEHRTKEIGIRKAMGASKVEILRLLLWQFAKPVLWANVVAWPRRISSCSAGSKALPITSISRPGCSWRRRTGAGDCGAHRHRPRAAVARAQPVTALRYE